MVEFAAVLLPIMLVVVGIIQFGLLFNAEVTLTNAAREGGREGTVYVYRYGTTDTQTTNDTARCTAAVQSTTAAFGLLATTSPHFTASSACTAGNRVDANTWVNGDLRITYSQPAGVVTSDARRNYRMTVRVTYRSDIIVPLIGTLLPTDGNGRFIHVAEVAMVIN
jgi:Flp pilus assembly protein TadG